MNRIAVLATCVLTGLLVGMVLGIPLQARAHSVQSPWATTANGDVWRETETVAPLSTDAGKTAANNAANTWSAVSGSNFDYFNKGNGPASTSLSCSSNQSYEVTVGMQNLTSGAIGQATKCVSTTSGKTEFGRVELDSVLSGTAWSTDGSPSTSEYDFQYVVTHELGHIVGAAGLTGTTYCQGLSTDHTMCEQGVTGTIGGRSLATHDKDGVAAYY